MNDDQADQIVRLFENMSMEIAELRRHAATEITDLHRLMSGEIAELRKQIDLLRRNESLRVCRERQTDRRIVS